MKSGALLSHFISKSREIIAIYLNPLHCDRFIVGQYLVHDDNNLVVSAYDENGDYDGLYLCNLESVFRIEKNCEYLNNVKEKIQDYSESICFSGDIWRDYWEHFHNRLVKIRCKKNSFYGFPVFCTESSISFLRIYRNGKRGKQCRIKKGDFIMSCCGSEEKKVYENYMAVNRE